jgi:hypothetical protein
VAVDRRAVGDGRGGRDPAFAGFIAEMVHGVVDVGKEIDRSRLR